MRPVLFLDVDGVLNALRQTPWAKATRTRVHPDGSHFGYQINTSVLLGERLQQLEVDIHWLTTWRDEANTLIAPLAGLPDDLPVVQWGSKIGDASIIGKTNAVSQWAEANPGHPYIWVDDEHDERYLTTDRSLVIGPNPRHGLVPEEIDLIEQWVLDLAAAVPFEDGSPTAG